MGGLYVERLVVYGELWLFSVCCDLSMILGKKKKKTSIKFNNPWSLPHFYGIVLLCKVFLKFTYFREMLYLLFTTNRLKRKKTGYYQLVSTFYWSALGI